MNLRILGVAVVVAILVAIGGCQPKTTAVKEEVPKVETSMDTPSKPQPGKVVVDEEIIVVLAGEPESHFKKAHESFAKKNFKASAADIRKGAALIKLEAARAADEVDKKALVASADELKKLADSVQDGSVWSADEMKRAFARADYALAKHYHAKAKESWAKKEAKATGHGLEQAAVHMERAASWSGLELEAGAKTGVKNTRVVAGKLIEGVGYVPDEVGKGIEFVGVEIEKLGKNVEPSKPD